MTTKINQPQHDSASSSQLTPMQVQIRTYSASRWLKHFQGDARELVLETLRSLPIDATVESKAQFRQTCLSISRIHPRGLLNLGATCWFNSLSQALFKPQGPFRDALLDVQSTCPTDQEYARLYDEVERVLRPSEHYTFRATFQEPISRLVEESTDPSSLQLITSIGETLHPSQKDIPQSFYKLSLQEALDTLSNRSKIRERIDGLLSLYDLANETPSDQPQARQELNNLFFSLITTFFEGFDQISIHEHQDLFEGLFYLQQYLGLTKQPKLEDRTQLVMQDFIQSRDCKHAKYGRNEPVSFIPVPAHLRSTAAGFQDYNMTPELMDEDLEFKGSLKRIPGMKISYPYSEKPFPDKLMFQILRFVYDPEKFNFSKVMDEVLCSDKISIPAYNKDGNSLQAIHQYLLRGVICHLGNLKDRGHYVYYQMDKPGDTSSFTLYDDASVKQMKKGSELFQKHLGTICRNGYLAVYDKGRSWTQLKPEHTQGYPLAKEVIPKYLSQLQKATGIKTKDTKDYPLAKEAIPKYLSQLQKATGILIVVLIALLAARIMARDEL